jgi:hypothetical protein
MRQQVAGFLTFKQMINTVNSFAAANGVVQVGPIAVLGPPPPPANGPASSASSSAIEEAPAPSDSVLDAVYADISVDLEEMDVNSEEFGSAMKEMRRSIARSGSTRLSQPIRCSSPLGV